MTKTEKAVHFLRGLRNFVRAIESLLIDTIAVFTPWLAPLIPAHMTYTSLLNEIQFSPFFATAGAVVVEFLGLTTIYTTFELWDANAAQRALSEMRAAGIEDPEKLARAEKRARAKKRAPVWVALLTAVFYLLVVLCFNVLLDPDTDTNHRLGKALLTLLTVDAGVLIAVRAIHARNMNALGEPIRPLAGNLPETYRKEPERKEPENQKDTTQKDVFDWRGLTPAQRAEIARMTPAELRAAFPGVPARTRYNWRQYAASEFSQGA